MAEGVFEYATLTDVEKHDLCMGLLAEFGVAHVNEQNNGELIHSCCIPHTRHKNGDKNPSASLNYKKLTYNCLGCGSSGGLLWMIATCRGIDGAQVKEWLGSQTGVGGRVMDLPRLMEIIDQIFHRTVESTPIPRYDPAVLAQWFPAKLHPYLTTGVGKVKGRQVPETTLDLFRVKYAPEYTDGTDRVIIPHFWHDRLVGWQARCLPGYQGSDKYRNTPDFPKDRSLYNLSRRDRIVLVESPMSVLRHYHHMPDLSATFGAKVTEAQIRLATNFREVVLWFDNDKAGWSATRLVARELSRHVGVRVVDSPWDADPADLDDDTVDTLIEKAIPESIWNPPRKLQEV